MRSTILLALLAFSPAVSSAATVQLVSGSGSSTILFQEAGGGPLVGGHLFAGTFAAPPSVGLSLSDIEADFSTFAPLMANPTNEFGFVGNSSFSGELAGFESKKIYVVALDTDSVATATQHAVFSADTGSWQFQATETGFDPEIDLTTVNEFFSGSSSSITDPGSVSGTFNTIQLIPEPGTGILCLLGITGLLRRRR